MLKRIIKYLPILSSESAIRSIQDLICSRRVSNYLYEKDRSTLSKLKNLNRMLIISDANIGDSINTQSCIEALRYYFPDCKIDYVCSSKAYPIIYRNPYISNTCPIFQGNIIPSRNDILQLQNLLLQNSYDLIMNFCPFVSKQDLKYGHCPVILPIRLIINIIKALNQNENANLMHKMVEYIDGLVSLLPVKSRNIEKKYHYRGTNLFLSDSVLAERKKFMDSAGLYPDKKIVFFNPDTSNSYTFINQDLQLELLITILSNNNCDYLLLGSGYNFIDVDKVLFDRIPSSLKKKVINIPKTLSIDVYASLIDICSLFITGDTGQMHIAAAKKVTVDSGNTFKNHTAIVSLFGATNSRIYGYDSFRYNYIPANQKAPSKLFESSSSCKNITCSIQRVTNKCSKHRCFEGLDINDITNYILDYLSK